MMVDDVYRELARRLDEIPNGFASTESGAEFDLLARLFTPEEAALASVMRLSLETPERIAEHAGTDAGSVETRLREMRAKGLIGARKDESGASYSLIPFIVGIYENQLTRMDEELARLVERYIVDSRGGSPADGGTAVHRVIPVEQSVPLDLEIFPYERATRLLDSARSWGVRDCICRVQQKLVGKGCDNTVENCLMLSPQAGAFDDSDATRPISRDEAQQILSQAADEGLVHSTMNQRDHIYYICNCC
ncbi:MAG: 4Fe-4S ferredoxin, partial [Candidatus Eisenbacteria sp.]|nr:4Fe-4S ferredoxin [Candidatus Eisenbacteria bacterium]